MKVWEKDQKEGKKLSKRVISEQVPGGKLQPDPPGDSGCELPSRVCLWGRELGFHTLYHLVIG